MKRNIKGVFDLRVFLFGISVYIVMSIFYMEMDGFLNEIALIVFLDIIVFGVILMIFRGFRRGISLVFSGVVLVFWMLFLSIPVLNFGVGVRQWVQFKFKEQSYIAEVRGGRKEWDWGIGGGVHYRLMYDASGDVNGTWHRPDEEDPCDRVVKAFGNSFYVIGDWCPGIL
ncbi:hypothetical protein [Pandoraea sp. PE-S2R-1]|uniref:hypothetical protein n=1 Tax=Pandoraea sp. PE-S2R-1 TaxID=1986994 RepID=UPI000B3FE4D3|nr:hypothetical protein [Pandoraea sp. PE-S2R-1]